MRNRLPLLSTSAALTICSSLLAAQSGMPGMSMPPPSEPKPSGQSATPVAHGEVPSTTMSMSDPRTLIEAGLQHTSSGTSIEPLSTPMAMLMASRRGWTLMLHGNAFVANIQQHAESSRGADRWFSTNWIMPMAQHKLGEGGQLTLRTMLSIEPATITGRRYPELFQEGETAYGKPIADGQHPHDLFMELAAIYDLHLGQNALFSLYLAPVGDPAVGPIAYPHRLSASEDPIAALGHHQQDSTHIAFNVITAGLTYRTLRLEGSGFHGAEPTESRWQPEPSPNGHAVDSYSTRLTWTPTLNLAAQYSIAKITSPETLNPADNQRRQTASMMFNRTFGAHQQMAGMQMSGMQMPGMQMSGDAPAAGNWATTLLWGQTRSSQTGDLVNSYLVESLLKFKRTSYLWTRVEVAGRSSQLLDQPTGAAESPVGHVEAYTLGYDHDLPLLPHVLVAPGVQFTVYHAPDALAPTYGRTPVGGVAFVRFRLSQ